MSLAVLERYGLIPCPTSHRGVVYSLGEAINAGDEETDCQTKRFLLGGNNPDHTDLVKTLSAGADPVTEIEAVSRPREALGRLDGQPCDALLLDYDLPDVNGLELLREIVGRAHQVSIVMVTGRGDEVAVRAMKAGA